MFAYQFSLKIKKSFDRLLSEYNGLKPKLNFFLLVRLLNLMFFLEEAKAPADTLYPELSTDQTTPASEKTEEDALKEEMRAELAKV